MCKQNIFIINFNSLYKILNEIKETLPFNITNYDDELDLIKTPILDIKNSLFISQFNLKFLTNIKLNQKNSLDFNNFPLSLNKLVELINIKLIKLKFSHQSKININEYDLNINSRVLSNDEKFILSHQNGYFIE